MKNIICLETVLAVQAVDGVVRANIWSKNNESRIYVDLIRKNGSSRGNPGGGHSIVIYQDGRVDYNPRSNWLGANTRNWHTENETLEKIEAVVKRMSGTDYVIDLFGDNEADYVIDLFGDGE